ncbi:hypothetical protein IP91_02252 [Pseudoduganella lurida]|uniref:Uncharacterized protein n=1 Tax=Pseudoduganella lurida TaxID=1036180 RepID=A0A562RBK9_9BURK|nr:hypothetical protein [Pseudoduganella lurida]TWI66435.1 hypothetical protein IP91_02252 [Pseudoduganella lurida]
MVDTSKPGKGILASLEQRAVAAPRRTTTPGARGAAFIGAGGLLLALLLAWWVLSGPSPLLVQDPLRGAALPPATSPAPPLAAHPAPPAEPEAAAIINDTPPPGETTRQVAAAALATTPIASVVMRSEPAPRKPSVKPPRKEPVARIKPPVRNNPPAPARPTAAPSQDSDVTLLAALVAHANAGKRHRETPPIADTAAMLGRCATLPGEEHRVCRARICAAAPAEPACRAD